MMAASPECSSSGKSAARAARRPPACSAARFFPRCSSATSATRSPASERAGGRRQRTSFFNRLAEAPLVAVQPLPRAPLHTPPRCSMTALPCSSFGHTAAHLRNPGTQRVTAAGTSRAVQLPARQRTQVQSATLAYGAGGSGGRQGRCQRLRVILQRRRHRRLGRQPRPRQLQARRQQPQVHHLLRCQRCRAPASPNRRV